MKKKGIYFAVIAISLGLFIGLSCIMIWFVNKSVHHVDTLKVTDEVTDVLVGTQYYVDAKDGNDQNDGLSDKTAFKSLERVNQLTLEPGDRVLFRKDRIWYGALQPKGSGSAEYPIVIGTYGDGYNKPVINGMGTVDAAIHMVNISHIEVRNLEVTNCAEKADAYRSGILFEARGQNVKNVAVRECYVHDVTAIDYALEDETVDGHWFGGIQVKSIKTSLACQVDDVVIENNKIENVGRTAITVCGWLGGTKCRNVTVRGNRISNIDGDGIILAGVDTGTIEKNVVSKCSQVEDDRVSVSIFAITSNDVKIQYNEAYLNNHNGDAQGFDIDGDCDNTILQYNYSHDNAGGFLLLVNNTKNGKAVVRYNISENDAGYLYRFDFATDVKTDYCLNAHIYNNTTYTTQPLIKVVYLWGQGTRDDIIATFENNIFHILFNESASYDFDTQNMVFDHNVFYGDDLLNEPDDINKVKGNPLFVSAGTGGNGRNTLDGYKLQEGSSCLGSGKLIEHNGGYDFWGNPVSATQAPNIGAYNGTATSVPEDTNLALSKQAHGSSANVVYKVAIGKYYFQACDGDKSTVMETKPVDEADNAEYVFVDLENTFNISRIVLHPAEDGVGFPKDFTISIYNEKTDKWEVVSTHKNYKTPKKGQSVEIALEEAHRGSKVRLDTQKLSKSTDGTGYQLRIAEMEVYQ